MILELPEVYPNGIAFDAQGRLYWTESMAHRVCRLEDGAPTVFCQLSDDYVPDGMAFAADGRAFVCTTISEGVTVISADGELLEQIDLGEHATNCIFAGSTLYVTATHIAEIEASQRTGTLWAVETDATGGLPLIPPPSRAARGLMCNSRRWPCNQRPERAVVPGTVEGLPARHPSRRKS